MLNAPLLLMPLRRIRSLQYRWLHFLQRDTIITVFSSSSLAATSSLGEAIEMKALVEPQAEDGTGAGHDWLEVIRGAAFPPLAGWDTQPYVVRPVRRDDLGAVRRGGLAVLQLLLHLAHQGGRCNLHRCLPDLASAGTGSCSTAPPTSGWRRSRWRWRP
jgi:hypothetical protein